MATAPLARLFRIDPEQRRKTVSGMLERHHTEAASYWTQLVLAAGIATFGLVLDSGAVIIGAMLVAPLMGPIVELAMGLAVGSALLALRSAIRIVISVLVVVLLAGVLTRMLPFQAVTAEVAARTSPTVLDLMVACFCALTAAFVTLKPHDTVSTAAGTSISISLVPPLCASGFGIGIRALHVSRGALLLFTANLSAILLFALIAFLLAGFGSVDAASLENGVLGDMERKGTVARLATRLNTLFGSRHSTVFKMVLPVGLVAAVFVPLQQALATVSAEVRARQQVVRILDERAELKNALMTSVAFDQGRLAVRLVVLGDPAAARELERELRERVEKDVGANAAVSVIGVPDAAAVARLATAARPAPLPIEQPPPPKVVPLVELNRRVGAALRERYPESEAGPLLDWTLAGDKDPPELRLTHFGPPLGAAATRLLAEALLEPLDGPVRITEDAVSREEHTFTDLTALAIGAGTLRARLASIPRLRICVEVPAAPKGFASRPAKPVETAIAALGVPAEDVREGKACSLRVSEAPCTTAPASEAK